MKKLLVLLIAVAFVLAGCGKSAEQKKMELDLSAQVQKLHDAGMASMKQVDELTGKIDAAVAMHDSLVKAFPKLAAGHPAEDLIAAKGKLASVKSAMDTWMKGFKPYNETMKHEEAVTMLKKNVEDLTKMKGEIDASVTAATTAIDAHAKAASELMAQASKTIKKVKK
jgi:uncharacterized lipoprotein YmbA